MSYYSSQRRCWFGFNNRHLSFVSILNIKIVISILKAWSRHKLWRFISCCFLKVFVSVFKQKCVLELHYLDKTFLSLDRCESHQLMLYHFKIFRSDSSFTVSILRHPGLPNLCLWISWSIQIKKCALDAWYFTWCFQIFDDTLNP